MHSDRRYLDRSDLGECHRLHDHICPSTHSPDRTFRAESRSRAAGASQLLVVHDVAWPVPADRNLHPRSRTMQSSFVLRRLNSGRRSAPAIESYRRPINAGGILQRLAGAKVQHGRKQEGPRYRGPSCLWQFTPERRRPMAVRTWPWQPAPWARATIGPPMPAVTSLAAAAPTSTKSRTRRVRIQTAAPRHSRSRDSRSHGR